MLTYENDVRVWNFKFLLAQKYEVVVTNPPYMGGSGMSGKLAEFVKKECPDSKSDLFAAFIERGLTLTKPTGFNCMVTMQSWMFLSSFEKLRTRILSTRTITNLLHMENMVMGIAFGTAVSNLRSIHIEGYKGKYNHITMADIEGEKPIEFPIESKRNVTADSANFAKIPGSPVAYWVSEALYMVFGSKERMMNIGKALQGSITGDNDRFLRLWYEVSWINTSYRCTNTMDTHSCRWFPHSKGGEYRKWYGNNEYLINWLNDGMEIRSFFDSGGKLRSRPQNVNFFFKKGVTWSDLTSGGYAARFVDDGFTFNVTGPTFFPYDNNDILNTLGYMNSPVFQALLDICSPGLHYHNGVISILPYRTGNCKEIDAIVTDNVSLSRADWDAFETSWDFKRHPLV
jgi:hypothetical protein